MTVEDIKLDNPELEGFMHSPDVYPDETDLAAYRTLSNEGRPVICLVTKSRNDDTPASVLDPDRIAAVAECHEIGSEEVLHVDILDPSAPIPAIATIALRASMGEGAENPILEVATPPQIPCEEVTNMLQNYLRIA